MDIGKYLTGNASPLFGTRVFSIRMASTLTRYWCGALFALLLAFRLLSPNGFMPAFGNGAVTIVACPDADRGASAPMRHHHDNAKHRHQPCPFASASPLGALDADFGVAFRALIVATTLLLGRAFLLIERNSVRVRPPTRGPPISA